MKNFLTSDLHLGHANIIRYCNRPFRDVEHMNSTIIRNWNERVKQEDHVYHLGDFCFKNSNEIRGEGTRSSAADYITLLNGQKHWVRGNHDRNNSLKTIVDSIVITYAGQKYFMTHSPQDCNHSYPINFVGHVHERWKFKKYGRTYLINVGVDVNDFYPKTIEEILNEFKHYLKNNQLEEYQPYVK